jgi:tRNA1(Val) A37 N6-methylase TrmN6
VAGDSRSGTWPEGALTLDRFLGGRISLNQPKDGFRSGSDAVFLGAAVPACPGDSVLELGCGAGAALLCLGARVAGLDLNGLELQPGYAALARDNARRNAMAATIHQGSVAAMPAALKARQFGHVLLNPPYFAEGTASRPTDAGRGTAHVEDAASAPLPVWLDAAIARAAPRGSVTMIQRAERLGDILSAIGTRLGAVTVLPLAARPGQAADRVIVSGRKGRRAALRLLPPFVLHDGSGPAYAGPAEAVLRHAAALGTGKG